MNYNNNTYAIVPTTVFAQYRDFFVANGFVCKGQPRQSIDGSLMLIEEFLDINNPPVWFTPEVQALVNDGTIILLTHQEALQYIDDNRADWEQSE